MRFSLRTLLTVIVLLCFVSAWLRKVRTVVDIRDDGMGYQWLDIDTHFPAKLETDGIPLLYHVGESERFLGHTQFVLQLTSWPDYSIAPEAHEMRRGGLCKYKYQPVQYVRVTDWVGSKCWKLTRRDDGKYRINEVRSVPDTVLDAASYAISYMGADVAFIENQDKEPENRQ